MNLLFICTQNEWRSRTAEEIFHGLPGHEVRSAGTASSARIKVNSKLITWADIIFTMENKHTEILQQKFPEEISKRKIICLNIPDYYHYMDEELVKLLQLSVQEYINNFS